MAGAIGFFLMTMMTAALVYLRGWSTFDAMLTVGIAATVMFSLATGITAASLAPEDRKRFLASFATDFAAFFHMKKKDK